MELRHMRYFVAVAEHLNYGRAADALATSQPSLSRQIVQLEDELGVMLFERTNRRVALTDAGRLFLIDARRTLLAADVSVRHARESADGTRGEIRIGFIGGAMLMMLPGILREFRRRNPDIVVLPIAMQYPEHVPALHAGRIDIAWTIAVSDPDIISQGVTADRLVAVVPSDHRLAEKTQIDIAGFRGESLITLARAVAPVLFDNALDLCATNGFRPVEIIEVGDEATVLGLVAAGFGIAFAPYPWSVLQILGIAFRDVTADVYIHQALSWHHDRDTPIVKSFVATALELLASR